MTISHYGNVLSRSLQEGVLLTDLDVLAGLTHDLNTDKNSQNVPMSDTTILSSAPPVSPVPISAQDAENKVSAVKNLAPIRKTVPCRYVNTKRGKTDLSFPSYLCKIMCLYLGGTHGTCSGIVSSGYSGRSQLEKFPEIPE